MKIGSRAVYTDFSSVLLFVRLNWQRKGEKTLYFSSKVMRSLLQGCLAGRISLWPMFLGDQSDQMINPYHGQGINIT